jgi:DNA-binding NarL/FixJ family response regulator
VVVVPVPVARARAAAHPGQLQTLIVDRQPLFTAALGSLLAGPPLLARVWTASRSDEAMDIVRRGAIRLVFCDVGAEPTPGRELAATLASLEPPVPLILLGDPEDHERMTAALSTSAAGVFTKDSSLEEFLVGVDAVLSGHRAIGAGLISHLLDRIAQPGSRHVRTPGPGQLSPTELEILAMIGDAESITSIAVARGISHKTVRNHLAKIYRKLELHGRTEAMLWAARMGLTADRRPEPTTRPSRWPPSPN